MQEGRPIWNRTGGNPEPPPAPENHGPGSRFPPDPLPASPRNDGSRRSGDPGRCKARGSRCAHDRGTCRHDGSGRSGDRGTCTGRKPCPAVPPGTVQVVENWRREAERIPAWPPAGKRPASPVSLTLRQVTGRCRLAAVACPPLVRGQWPVYGLPGAAADGNHVTDSGR